MLRKLALLVTVTGLVVASTLVPLETQAGGHEWKRQVHGYRDGYRGVHVTVVTQPTHQGYWPYYAPHSPHHDAVVYAPVERVWVPAGWHWTGYQWVWVSSHWR